MGNSWGDYLVLATGLFGIVVWSYAVFCIFYQQIVVDRILSRSKYWYILVIFFMIALLPFSITTVAHFNGVQPYDILFYNNLYGQGGDLEQKVEYRAEIQRRIVEQAEDPSLLGTVFFHFRGIGGQYAAGTPRGRVWAIWIGIIGTLLFSGLLIPSVLSITRKRSDDWQWGEARYNIQRSRYAVILGGHECVPALIRQLLARKEHKLKYVIVQTTNNVFYYREELQRELTEAEEFHTVLYCGGRNTLADMKYLHLERASEVYLLGESEGREYAGNHDALNMLCLRNMATILADKRRRQRMKVYTLFEYQATMASFRYSDLSTKVREQIEFISLNVHQLWAQNVLVKRQSRNLNELSYLPLEGGFALGPESPKHVHLIVVGMSKAGLALAEEACQICHYPNFVSHGLRTRFTFIDASADREMTYFVGAHQEVFKLARHRYFEVSGDAVADDATAWIEPMADGEYKHLSGKVGDSHQVCQNGAEAPAARVSAGMSACEAAKSGKVGDCPQVCQNARSGESILDFEWEFVKGRIETPQVAEYLKRAVADPDAIVTVAICLGQTQQAMASAIYMPREVFRKAVQVLVLQKHSAELIANLAGIGKSEEDAKRMRYNIIRPFGMNTDIFAKDSVVDYRLAKLVNYVYNRTDDTRLEHINDVDAECGLTLQEKFWQQCSVSDQWSSNFNANSIPTKLRYLGLDFESTPVEEISRRLNMPGVMEMLVRVEHNRWNTEKLLTGFRPLNAQEMREFDALIEGQAEYAELKALKKQYQKGWEMAHLDIVNFQDLEHYDAPSIVFDEILTRALPYIVLRWRESVLTA